LKDLILLIFKIIEIKKIKKKLYIKDKLYIMNNLPKAVHSVDIYDNICKKALDESKKPFINNIANGDDIIEISIKNNEPFLTKSNNSAHWKCRRVETIKFLEQCCKLLDSQNPINLVINIGLHDCYHSDLGIMVFSLRHENQKNIVIPDSYAMGNYGGKLNISLGTSEINNNSAKIKGAFFVGASTGSGDPRNNERLQLCNKYVNHPNIKCYINNFCQIDFNNIKNTYPNYELFKSNHIDSNIQLKYKYVISVDGNTVAWDRVPWILNSKSVLLKKKSSHKNWYYDFLIKNEHYIEFDDDSELENIINNTPDEECKRIIDNANIFCKNYLHEISHLTYMSKLLYYLSLNNK
jgi:hypothetical protein